jgi:hypothetical protein
MDVVNIDIVAQELARLLCFFDDLFFGAAT